MDLHQEWQEAVHAILDAIKSSAEKKQSENTKSFAEAYAAVASVEVRST